MNEFEDVIEWIEDLSDFSYNQMQGSFSSAEMGDDPGKRENEFYKREMCCICVLDHIQDQTGTDNDNYEEEGSILHDSKAFRDKVVVKNLHFFEIPEGWDDQNKRVVHPSFLLVDLNDNQELTHPEIAAFLLANVDVIFTPEAADAIKEHFWGSKYE